MSNFEYDIQKQLVQAQGNGFQLEDQTTLVQFDPINPGLLTVLMGAMNEANRIYFQTNSFQYDELTTTAQLPTGKAYSERGGDLKKDKPRTLRYEIGSKGTRFNVAPQDYVNRRKPGTANEFLTESDVLAGMNVKNMKAWDYEMELEMASILTSDQNRVSGGPFETYNYYTDIVGTSRPSATDMDLGNATDPIVDARYQRKLLEQEVAKAGLSVTGWVMICGDDYFEKRYDIEKQESLARELRSQVDLASQAVPTIEVNNLRHDNFDSHDGITYINYGSAIIGGSKMIADADAYLMPVLSGDSMIKLGFAPAQHRDYVNTQALPMYSWQYIDGFQGVTAFYERNMLTVLQRPKLIAHLTTTS